MLDIVASVKSAWCCADISLQCPSFLENGNRMHTALPEPTTTCWCFEILQGQMILLTHSAVTLMSKSSEYQNWLCGRDWGIWLPQ